MGHARDLIMLAQGGMKRKVRPGDPLLPLSIFRARRSRGGRVGYLYGDFVTFDFCPWPAHEIHTHEMHAREMHAHKIRAIRCTLMMYTRL
jgi:hypothetical protein